MVSVLVYKKNIKEMNHAFTFVQSERESERRAKKERFKLSVCSLSLCCCQVGVISIYIFSFSESYRNQKINELVLYNHCSVLNVILDCT